MIIKVEFSNKNVKKKENKKSGKVHDHDFYKSGTYIDYITRQQAVYIQKDDVTKQVLKQEYQDRNIEWEDFLDSKLKMNFLTDDQSKTGLYRLFGKQANDLSIEKEKKIVKQISDNQNIWEMTINPGQLGIDTFSIDKQQWNDMLNKNMKSFFKANKIDPNKITGHWVIHSNTKYPHIHLSFWEKYPDINGNYRKKGSFNKESVEKLKTMFETSLTYQEEYEDFYVTKNSIWDSRKEMKQLMKEQNTKTVLYNSVKTIRSFYQDSRNKNYAVSKNVDELKQAVWNIFDHMKDNNPKLNNEYEKYINAIEEVKNTNYESKELQQQANDFVNNEFAEFESQIGNIIIKDCLGEQASSWSDDSLDLAFNWNEWDRIFREWEWEFENIQFWKKIEALKKYNKNIKETKISSNVVRR
ncbi:integrative conjugal element protein [Mycoplasma cottewii]|uniref:Integrative conjugal element protein n=1 Tax=Mycoplasma cottewii TaxID=51364 RepID=A0ABY5TVS4_9MOLU|nr:integrative conjugal element protein [Mycoplasma cottewii]UWD34775.1 integrative conjugal element protein [Mycoplasma cottewii]